MALPSLFKQITVAASRTKDAACPYFIVLFRPACATRVNLGLSLTWSAFPSVARL